MSLDNLTIRIMRREGWDTETNDPADSGGNTKFGVTQSTLNSARRKYPSLPSRVSDLTVADTKLIFSNEYMREPKFDLIYNLTNIIGEQVIDFGILAGPSTSARLLQRVLNVLNNEEKRWPDIKVDGIIGNASLGALSLAVTSGYAKDVSLSLAALQGAYLIELAERRVKDERFIRGWQAKRAVGLLLDLIDRG